MLLDRAVPIDGGDYVIGGRAPGHEEWKATVSVPITKGRVSVDVPKFKDIAKLVAAQPKPVEAPRPDNDGADADEDPPVPG